MKITKPQPTGANMGQVIYLGPSFVERTAGGLAFTMSYGMIYRNGVPEDVAKKMETDPDFKRLFVPVEKTGAALADLAKESPMAASRARINNRFMESRKAGKHNGQRPGLKGGN